MQAWIPWFISDPLKRPAAAHSEANYSPLCILCVQWGIPYWIPSQQLHAGRSIVLAGSPRRRLAVPASDLPFGRARLGGVLQRIPLAGHTTPLIALLSPLGWLTQTLLSQLLEVNEIENEVKIMRAVKITSVQSRMDGCGGSFQSWSHLVKLWYLPTSDFFKGLCSPLPTWRCHFCMFCQIGDENKQSK